MTDKTVQEICFTDTDLLKSYRKKLPAVTEKIITSCSEHKCNRHVDYDPIPSKQSVVEIINHSFDILFPGFFAAEKIDPVNLQFYVGQSVTRLFSCLAEQVTSSVRHDCLKNKLTCIECVEKGYSVALETLNRIPELRDILAQDIEAAYEGDPAASSYDEIVFSYPGIYAITVYRLAHLLDAQKVPLLPRIMTEYAHGKTGINIHPGAKIGDRFVIDHGTGVVIGETTTIGHNVRIYQGVTLGALSLPRNAGEALKGKKRHPNIEDDVIIYSGATILGGETTIGAGSVIGGNVWLTESIPANTTVMLDRPKLVYKSGTEQNNF